MKKLWFFVVLIFMVVVGCENEVVDDGGGKGSGLQGGEGEKYSLVGEWDVYCGADGTNKLVGEAVFTETTIYTKYDYAGATTIMDSKYEIVANEVFPWDTDTSWYLRIPDNYMDSPKHDYTLDCTFWFISQDSVSVYNFIYHPDYVRDIMPPAHSAILVRKGG